MATIDFTFVQNVFLNTHLFGISWLIPTIIALFTIIGLSWRDSEGMKDVALPVFVGWHIVGLKQNILFILIAAIIYVQHNLSMQVIGQALQRAKNVLWNENYVRDLRQRQITNFDFDKKYKGFVADRNKEAFKLEAPKFLQIMKPGGKSNLNLSMKEIEQKRPTDLYPIFNQRTQRFEVVKADAIKDSPAKTRMLLQRTAEGMARKPLDQSLAKLTRLKDKITPEQSIRMNLQETKREFLGKAELGSLTSRLKTIGYEIEKRKSLNEPFTDLLTEAKGLSNYLTNKYGRGYYEGAK